MACAGVWWFVLVCEVVGLSVIVCVSMCLCVFARVRVFMPVIVFGCVCFRVLPHVFFDVFLCDCDRFCALLCVLLCAYVCICVCAL